ncbi:MAG: MutS-related protein [Vicinamibacterales bacterium]
MIASTGVFLAAAAAAFFDPRRNVKPAQEYRQRLDARRAAHARLAALDERLSYARLAVFAAGAVAAWLAFRADALSPWWLAGPVAVFAWLMRRHDGVVRARDAAARAAAFYERGLARIEDRWIGGGEPGDRFRDDEHLYANDLDLFGHGSLFELLSIARTRAGEDTVAAWLTSPASPDVVGMRQQAIDEMTPRLDLRESLALAGTDVRAGVNPTLLVEWAASPFVLGARWPWLAAAGLTSAAVAAAIYSIATGTLGAIVVVALLEAVAILPFRGRVQHVLHAADQAARDLDVLAHVLEQLERERFESARLSELRAALGRGGVTASRTIRHLHDLAGMHDWQHNQFFAPFAAFLLWGTHLAHAIEHWRTRHGSQVGGWLALVGELEALSSLSAYRYEHPGDVFPEIVERGPASFDGDALGHPLLPAARMVRNDVHLAGQTRLLVVSGSNMSGKSTLLRTVGINAVLALAGAPVRA